MRMLCMVVGMALILVALSADARVLPRDPDDGFLLENDLLGLRVWGPPSQPTITLGRSDLWDRRWFADHQPLITLAQIRKLAMSGNASEVPANSNKESVYGKYDFPCPKPGMQIILQTPFATCAEVKTEGSQGLRLLLEGEGKKLDVQLWVHVKRLLVVMTFKQSGLGHEDFRLRVYRHRDTIAPGMDPRPLTAFGWKSETDFEQMVPPKSFSSGEIFGVTQDFPAEPTFPAGFRNVVAVLPISVEADITERNNEVGLGTPLWAPVEGLIVFGKFKEYKPINEAPGSASTASFKSLPPVFYALATSITTQDGGDPDALARRTLMAAQKIGISGLEKEQSKCVAGIFRKNPARIIVNGKAVKSSWQPLKACVYPSLRKKGGYYGDIALCSVATTKFCFQDSACWHGDFHLNEIHPTNLLTWGEFDQVLHFCRMLRTMLPMAEENAHDVYEMPGAMYPLAHFPLRTARGIAYTNPTWELDLGLNGEICRALWLYYRYTGDKQFLRDTAYPVMKACAQFNATYLSEGEDGLLHIIPTVSPELWGVTNNFERNKDCLSALTLTRYLLLSASEAARVLGCESAETKNWREITKRLAPYPTYDTEQGKIWVDVAGAPPAEYNVAVPLAAVFWGDEVGLDSDEDTLKLARRTAEHINIWEPHRFYLDWHIRPRLGICRDASKIDSQNCLLSYQSIRIFPAVPPNVEVKFENLAAEGGFTISAIHTKGDKIKDVHIVSHLGKSVRMANPWPGKSVKITECKGKEQNVVTQTGEYLRFQTRKGSTYLLEKKLPVVSAP